jgi:hypothetical protein
MTKQLKPCREDQYRHPTTNRCRKKPASSKRSSPKRSSPKRSSPKRSSPKRSSPKRSSPKRSSPKSKKIKTLKPCREDQYRHPTTNRCRKKPASSKRSSPKSKKVKTLKPCRDDQYRDPTTNRCRKKEIKEKCFFIMNEKGYDTYIPFLNVKNKKYVSQYYVENLAKLIFEYFQVEKSNKLLKTFKKYKGKYILNNKSINSISDYNQLWDATYLIDIIKTYMDKRKDISYMISCELDKNMEKYWNEVIIDNEETEDEDEDEETEDEDEDEDE